MTCGCSSATKVSPATIAAMCAACPRWCGRSTPELVQLTAMGKPHCPLGKHYAGPGQTRFLGVRWYGVPMPVRLWLRLKGWLWDAHSPRACVSEVWDGCGCIVTLKAAAQRLRAILRPHTSIPAQ